MWYTRISTTVEKTIAAFEQSEKLVFQGLHETVNATKFEDHLRSICKTAVWGTNLEIIAAATLFALDVYSYKRGTAPWLKCSPYMRIKTAVQLPLVFQFYQRKKGKWIEIMDVNNNHFDAIVLLV